MRSAYFLCITFLFAASDLPGQAKVDNLTARQSGDRIELKYDLTADQSETAYLVKAFYAPREAGDFIEMVSVSGEIGSGIRPGRSKIAIWNAPDDMGNFSEESMRIKVELYSLPSPLTNFAWVEGGSFIMGSDDGDEDASPAHQLSVSDFFIERNEVTVESYRRFCNEENHPFPEEKIEWIANHPITFVSWYDAEAYCSWLRKKTNLPFRLPTEAEWEYAAKGGRYAKGQKFSGSDNINDVGWYKQNSVGTMHSAVGMLKPNNLGIYDMSGNVWEWCADWYNSKYYSFSPSHDPGGPSVGKVKVGRGGSWFNRDVGISFRYFVTPTSRTNYVGFRVACNAAGSAPAIADSEETILRGVTLKSSATVVKHQPPKLEIIEPRLARGEMLNYYGGEFTIKGRITSDAPILMTLVGGVETSLDEDGYFQKTVRLKYLENDITVRTYDIENQMAADTVQIYRLVNKDDEHPTLTRRGTDYALLIGTDKYTEFPALANPGFDVETIGNELQDHYGFSVEKVKNPSVEDFYSTLRSYGKRQYSSDDQLFIFVAGHGVFDNLFGDGYLVLSDSRKGDVNRTSYVSHSNLRTILNNIDCKHIFLVLDVCFGGTFDPIVAARGDDEYEKADKDEFIRRKMKYKSRLYLTSGGKEYVSDGRSGMHSPFAREFLSALRGYGGVDRILTVNEILHHIERVKPEPHFGEFGNNEPGSDFLFILK